MNDKRAFPRKRKRLLADIAVDGRMVSGFTWDLSHTGLFISSSYVPKLADRLNVSLHLPNGKKVECEGTVVRIRHVPAALAEGSGNHGFCLALGGYFEEYARYLGDLE